MGQPLVCTSAVVMCWCQLTPSAWMLTPKFPGVQAMGEHYRWGTTSMCHELSAELGTVHALICLLIVTRPFHKLSFCTNIFRRIQTLHVVPTAGDEAISQLKQATGGD
jgi:alcohol dehydrogenase YqhD (iron-dependent ADH family)